MTAPTLLVEFSFTKSGNDYVWEDISAYVRSVSIGRGISRELENYSAGQATVALSNNNRYFDPTYTSSPYYGSIVPAGALRITSGGVVIYYGFIDNWTFDYPDGGFDSVATVSAYDGLSNLAKANLDVTTTTSQTTGSRILTILNKSEVSWNPYLQDIDGGQNLVQSDTIAEGTDALSYCQSIAQSEPGDFFVSRTGAVTFRDKTWLDNQWVDAGSTTNYCTNPNFGTSASGWAYSVTRSSAFAQSDLYSLKVNYDTFIGSYYTTFTRTLSVTAGQSITFSMYVRGSSATATTYDVTASVGGTSSTTSVTYSDTNWNRVSRTVVAPSTGTLTIYFTIDTFTQAYYIDSVLIQKSASVNAYFDGTTRPTDTSTTRYVSAWTGTANLSSSTLTTQTLTITPVTDVTNLSDYSGTDIPYQDIKIVYASESLANRVSLTRVSGTVQTVEDTSLQATYGIRAFSNDSLLNTTDTAVLDMAYMLLTQYSRPEYRAESVTVDVTSLSGANQTEIIGLDIRSVVQVTFRAGRIGSQIVKYYSVIGVSHEISDRIHTVILNLASLQTQPFRLDSVVTGVLDLNVLAYP